MQFKVPQNIDMQDRIIGPLTLSQFFYLLFGGLLIYILFNKLALTGLSLFFWILAIPIGFLSLAMAFGKFNDRPFPLLFLSMIRFFGAPRQRIWQHDSAEPKNEKSNTATQKESISKAPKKGFDTVRVGELAKIMDTPREQQ